MDDGLGHCGEIQTELLDGLFVTAGDPDQLGGLGDRGAAKDGALEVGVLGRHGETFLELGRQGGVDGRGLDKDDRVINLTCQVDQNLIDLFDRRIVREGCENLLGRNKLGQRESVLLHLY